MCIDETRFGCVFFVFMVGGHTVYVYVGCVDVHHIIGSMDNNDD